VFPIICPSFSLSFLSLSTFLSLLFFLIFQLTFLHCSLCTLLHQPLSPPISMHRIFFNIYQFLLNLSTHFSLSLLSFSIFYIHSLKITFFLHLISSSLSHLLLCLPLIK
jgi:hypothetical protein